MATVYNPPTNKPADCICGAVSGNGCPRLDIVCPCCDGTVSITLSPSTCQDESKSAYPSNPNKMSYTTTVLTPIARVSDMEAVAAVVKVMLPAQLQGLTVVESH